jgi:hypothetical protein
MKHWLTIAAVSAITVTVIFRVKALRTNLLGIA